MAEAELQKMFEDTLKETILKDYLKGINFISSYTNKKVLKMANDLNLVFKLVNTNYTEGLVLSTYHWVVLYQARIKFTGQTSGHRKIERIVDYLSKQEPPYSSSEVLTSPHKYVSGAYKQEYYDHLTDFSLPFFSGPLNIGVGYQWVNNWDNFFDVYIGLLNYNNRTSTYGLRVNLTPFLIRLNERINFTNRIESSPIPEFCLAYEKDRFIFKYSTLVFIYKDLLEKYLEDRIDIEKASKNFSDLALKLYINEFSRYSTIE